MCPLIIGALAPSVTMFSPTLSSAFCSCSCLWKIGRSLPSSHCLLLVVFCTLLSVLQSSCSHLHRLLSQSSPICFVLCIVLPRTSCPLAITTDPLFYPFPVVPTTFLRDLLQVLQCFRGFSASPLSRHLSTPVTITENRPQPVTWNSLTVVCLLSHFFPFFRL